MSTMPETGEYLAEPHKGHAVRGEGQAAIGPLKRQDVDREHRTIEKQDAGGEERRQAAES